MADLYIEAIKQRSEKGIDRLGNDFAPYSDAYVKSLNFKIAGKEKDKVDLTLSGDMLASIQLLKASKGKLVIGFEDGSDENAIADGNIRGTYGSAKANRRIARDFLGLPDDELANLLSEFDSEEFNNVSSKRFKTVYK